MSWWDFLTLLGVVFTAVGLGFSIASYVNAQEARKQARPAAALSPRAQAIDHPAIQKNRVVSPADVMSMQDAKDRADLVFFNDPVTGDLARVIETADDLHKRGKPTVDERFAGAKPPSAEAIDALTANLEGLFTRMKADAALR